MEIVKSCCQSGDVEALRMYFRVYQKFDVNKTYKYKTRDDKWLETSYLITAAKQGLSEIVELLLNQKADVNLVCDGVTAVSMAVKYGHLRTVTILIKNGAMVNEQCLKFAVGNNDVQMIELLLSLYQSQTAIASVLMDICRSKRYVDDSTVEILARYCVDPKCLNSVFNLALGHFRFHICNILIAVTSPDESVSSTSVENTDSKGKSKKATSTMLDMNASLIESIKSGTDKHVSYCLNKGADWSAVDPDTGKTALVLASDRTDLKRFLPSSQQQRDQRQSYTPKVGTSSTSISKNFANRSESNKGHSSQASTDQSQETDRWSQVQKRQPKVKLIIRPVGNQ
jgi:hypothetical protein